MTSLSKSAICIQLQEMRTEYMENASMQQIGGRRVIAYGINLQKAYDAGLDVPQTFTQSQLVINL